MIEVSRSLKREPDPNEGDHELGANPFATMAPDHLASAAMVAMPLSEEGRALAATGWRYTLVLAVARIYLGEHYTIDESVACRSRPQSAALGSRSHGSPTRCSTGPRR